MLNTGYVMFDTVGLRRNFAILCTVLLAGMPAFRVALAQQTGGYVELQGQNLEIRLVLEEIGNKTGKSFVIHNGLEGKISIIPQFRIPREEVLPLILAILESRGYTILEKGSVIHVLSDKNSVGMDTPVVIGTQPPKYKGMITKVIKIEHISAIELQRVLLPLVRGGKEGALIAVGSTNHLILTDTASRIARLDQIVRELDRPGQAKVIEVVRLQHAGAEDVSRQLSAAAAGAEKAGRSVVRHMKQVAGGGVDMPGDAMIIPAPHANSILLVGAQVQLAELKRIIALLDVESPTGSGRLNAIFLKYMDAAEAAKSLSALLAKSETKDKDQPSHSGIAIEPDIVNNALLIESSPRDFLWVKDLIDKLDKMPQQVMIEVLLVEVGVTDKLDLGVEWAAMEQPTADRTRIVGRTRLNETDVLMDAITKGIFPQGLAVGLSTDVTDDGTPVVPFFLHALGQDTDVKILSKVPLWAQNNKPADISVVENIPILKSTIEGGSGTARDVIQNIERIDVGIKLNLTPHVNPDNEVTIELNPSIEAIIDEGPADQPFTPTISKREVKTTVTVPDKATIVISGLIREDVVSQVSKIPLLGDIPLIGRLFRRNSDRKQRTNLLIFVTPNIVTDMREAMRMKAAWENNTGLNATNAVPRQER